MTNPPKIYDPPQSWTERQTPPFPIEMVDLTGDNSRGFPTPPKYIQASMDKYMPLPDPPHKPIIASDDRFEALETVLYELRSAFDQFTQTTQKSLNHLIETTEKGVVAYDMAKETQKEVRALKANYENQSARFKRQFEQVEQHVHEISKRPRTENSPSPVQTFTPPTDDRDQVVTRRGVNLSTHTPSQPRITILSFCEPEVESPKQKISREIVVPQQQHEKDDLVASKEPELQASESAPTISLDLQPLPQSPEKKMSSNSPYLEIQEQASQDTAQNNTPCKQVKKTIPIIDESHVNTTPCQNSESEKTLSKQETARETTPRIQRNVSVPAAPSPMKSPLSHISQQLTHQQQNLPGQIVLKRVPLLQRLAEAAEYIRIHQSFPKLIGVHTLGTAVTWVGAALALAGLTFSYPRHAEFSCDCEFSVVVYCDEDGPDFEENWASHSSDCIEQQHVDRLLTENKPPFRVPSAVLKWVLSLFPKDQSRHQVELAWYDYFHYHLHPKDSELIN